LGSGQCFCSTQKNGRTKFSNFQIYLFLMTKTILKKNVAAIAACFAACTTNAAKLAKAFVTIALALISTSAMAQLSLSGTQTLNDGDNFTQDITLTGNVTFHVPSGTATISGQIAGGTFSLTKTGAGTLVYDNTGNTVSTTVVSAGKLQYGTGGTTGPFAAVKSAQTISIASGANLTVNRSSSATFNGAISGAGTLTKLGTGTLTLSGSNTYTGATTVSAGGLRIGNGGTAGTLASSVSVASGATLTFYRSDDYTYSGVISGAGDVSHSGSGKLTLSGTCTYTGKTTVALSGLLLPGSIRGSSEIALSSSTAYVQFDPSILAQTYSMPITGVGYVVKQSSVAITLSNAQYTGSTLIEAGRLLFSQSTAPPTNDIKVNGLGVVFNVSAGDTVTFGKVIWGTGEMRKSGTGMLVLTAANSYSGETLVQNGTLQIGNGGATGSIDGTSNIALDVATSNLVFNTTAATIVGVEIGGLGKVTKKSSGTLRFTYDNTYTGGTTIEAGTLYFGNNSAAGSVVGNIVHNGAYLYFNRSNDYSYSGVISGTGNVGKATIGAGKITLNGANTYTGSTLIYNGTLALGASGSIANSSYVGLNQSSTKFDISAGNKTIKSLRSTFAAAEVILGARTLSIYEEGTNTYAGIISGTSSSAIAIDKYGAGTLKLTGTASTYTGYTDLNTGTVEFSASASLGASSIRMYGGTLRWASGNTADVSARILVPGSNAIFDVQENNVPFATALSGVISQNVRKLGTGTLSSSAANTFIGTLYVDEGVWDVSGTDGALATQSVVVAQGAKLSFPRSVEYSYSGVISGAGQVENATAKLILTGANTFTGGLTANEDVQIGAGSTAGSIVSDVEVASGKTLTFSRSNAYTYAGVISGAGAVGKLAAGVLTLSGANTYTGATTIEAGQATLDATGTIAASSGISITGAAGRLATTGDKTIKGLTSAQSGSGVIINSGTLSITRSGASQSFAGVISGAGNLAVAYYRLLAGSYTAYNFTLANANTYTGTTTITGGALVLDAGGSIANSSELIMGRMGTVAVGYLYGTFNVSAGNKTIKAISGNYADNEVILGTSTLTIGTSAAVADGGGTYLGIFSGTGGGVAKTGLGTLSMSGENTATGLFTLSAGTLSLSSRWEGGLAQTSGSTFDVNGNVSIGGSLQLLGGGTIAMDLNEAPPARITVTGALQASGNTTLNIAAPAGNGQILIAAASGVTATSPFTLNMPGFTASLSLNSPTQLLLNAAITDNTPPTAGAALAADTSTVESVPLTWGAATDNQTPAASLRYFVYRSASSNLATVADCEANGTLLNAGGTLNLTSYNVVGLTPYTEYYFNVVVADMAGNKAAYTAVSRTTEKATLGGTVSITGTPRYGQTLTAVTTGLQAYPEVTLGEIHYQWLHRSIDTFVGTDSPEYTLVATDINQQITVRVWVSNTQGEVSAFTDYVAKAAQAAPAAPTVLSKTHNTITLNEISGAEYRLSTSASWQTSTVFDSLQAETDYQFVARVAETTTHTVSPESPISAIITTNVTPAINDVDVAPATVDVQKGNTQAFTATVTAVGGADATVAWSVSGNTSGGTGILAGVLTVATTETASQLTVKAASTFDGSKFGTATVNVQEIPAVTSVTVEPATAELTQGDTLQLAAQVNTVGSVGNLNVTWSIVEGHNAGTSISTAGVLTVDANEAATALTVRATSQFNAAKYGEATVQVNRIPAVIAVSVTPATVSVQKGNTQQFTADVTAVGGADISVTWSIVETHNVGTTVSASGLLTVAAAEVATSLTVRASSVFRSIFYGNATVTVTDVPITPEVNSVAVTPPTAALHYGENTQFNASVVAVGGASTAVDWSVSGNNSAGTTISASGLLSVAAGETASTLTVRASSTFDDSKFGTASVTLSAVPEVISVSVLPATASVQKGNTQQFSATVTVQGGAAETVTWSVSGGIAGTSISASGLLSVAAGETAATLTVTATSTANVSKQGTATVTVTAVPVTPEVISVSVSPATASVQKGNTQAFTATVTAVGGADISVTWSIVETHNVGTTVSASGLLTVAAAEAATSLTVRATSVFNTTIFGNATVSVTDVPITPKVNSVTVTPPTAALHYGENTQFSASVVAVGGASTAVAWSVSGNNSAGTTISASGMLSVAAAETASTITVRASSTFDGSKFGTATVTLSAALEVISVSVSPATASVQKGNTQPFTATVTVQGGAAETVTWSVSGGIAGTSISASGLLSVAAGETASTLTVTATSTANVSKQGTATVTVTAAAGVAVTGVSLNKPSTTIKVGDTETLTATVAPSNATNKTVSWSSSSMAVATVSSAGKVTAVSVGTSTITATTADGNKTATCTVTVTSSTTAVATQHATPLQVYPNPTTGLVYIDNPNGAEAEVYTLGGVLVLRSKAAVVDLSQQAAGVYVIKLGNRTAKVVKQ
jgi:autotransporter-associated beta strand protein